MTATLCPTPQQEADPLGIQGVNLQNSRALDFVRVIPSLEKNERVICRGLGLASPKNGEAERMGNISPLSLALVLTSCLDTGAGQTWGVSWFLSGAGDVASW